MNSSPGSCIDSRWNFCTILDRHGQMQCSLSAIKFFFIKENMSNALERLNFIKTMHFSEIPNITTTTNVMRHSYLSRTCRNKCKTKYFGHYQCKQTSEFGEITCDTDN